MEKTPLFATAVRWLEQQIDRVPYGEVSISIILHGGRIARIEKGFIEKTQEGGTHATL